MKVKHLLISILFLFPFLAKAQDTSGLIYTGNPMPEFTIVSDDGTLTPSSVFAGKVILINMFATWCPPCQLELADMEATLWPKLKDREDFVLLVIGREHSDAELAKYNEKKGFTFPLYPDKNRKIFSLFATQSIPRSYLVDKSGKVIYTTIGYEKDEFKRMQRIIDNALKE
jgi:peroxiredoxin